MSEPIVLEGDLLDQPVEAIVNPWNRNVIPWWLLIPQGVSGAIKKRGGFAPFQELAKFGPLPLGQAVLTGAGKLPFKGIIHVCGINLLWRSSEFSVRGSVRSAMKLARSAGFGSLAFPLIGAGSGAGDPKRVLGWIWDELGQDKSDGIQVTVVCFKKVDAGIQKGQNA